MKLVLLGATLVSLIAGQVLTANAQGTKLDWAEPLAGNWTLSGVSEGDPYCRVMLGTEGTIGGATLDISATCQRNFPLEEVAAWTIRDGAITLIDAMRGAVVSFEPQGDDGYGAEFSDGRVVTLDRGEPEAPESIAVLMDGSFDLSGPNNAASCGFMVEATASEQGNIEQVGACPDAWGNKRWSKWKYTAGRLNLLSDGGSTILSLTQADEFTFTTDGPDGPLFFGPGPIQGE